MPTQVPYVLAEIVLPAKGSRHKPTGTISISKAHDWESQETKTVPEVVQILESMIDAGVAAVV